MSYALFSREWIRMNKENDKAGLPYLSPEEANETIRSQWLAQKRYRDLVGYILENWTAGNGEEFAAPVFAALISENETALFVKLWKGMLRQRLGWLWNYDVFDRTDNFIELLERIDLSDFNPYSSQEPADRRLAYQRRFTMQGINTFIEGLENLGLTHEIEKAKALLEVVRTLQQPKPGPVTDKRKMDEPLFWQLIDEANEGADDRGQFMDNLRPKLEAFPSGELKKFDKWLITKANELNTWQHWALAYMAMQGCGDDAFDYFRPWVVSRGKVAFEAIKDLDETKIVTYFNEDPQLEDLNYLAAEIYEVRTADVYAPPRIKQSKINGTRWAADQLPALYPGLCKLFGYEV